MRSRGYGVLILSAVLISGCVPKGELVMIQNSKDAVYASGYTDGCESGRKEAGVPNTQARKDTNMYAANPRYQEAWDSGYKECKFREERVRKLESRN